MGHSPPPPQRTASLSSMAERDDSSSAVAASNSMVVPYAPLEVAVAPPPTRPRTPREPPPTRPRTPGEPAVVPPSTLPRTPLEPEVVPPYTRRRTPYGWRVRRHIRSDGSRSDRYFYKPGCGRKFWSIKEVLNFMNGEHRPFKSKTRFRLPSQRTRRLLVSGGKLLRLDNKGSKKHLSKVRAAPSILPDGWIVKEVHRPYRNMTDKYYYEPESGQMFRSLVAIEKYLIDLNDNALLSKNQEEKMENEQSADLNDDASLSKTLEEIMENEPLARAFKLENRKAKSTKKRKKKISSEKSQASSFPSPPMKVTWVITSAQGDSWNPFIAEVLVPDSVKQQWTNRFMLLMNDGTQNSQA